MRYFIDNESGNYEIMSLDDLRKEWHEMAKNDQEEDDRTFNDFLREATDYCGTISEISLECGHHVTAIADFMHELIIYETSLDKLDAYQDVIDSVIIDEIAYVDQINLTNMIRFRRYMIKKGEEK